MNQEDKVLNHLQNIGHITQIEAAQRYNIWRLAAVIHKLKKRGHCISTTKVRHKAGGFFGSYRLEGALGSPQNVFHIAQPAPQTDADKRVASLTLDALKKELTNDS